MRISLINLPAKTQIVLQGHPSSILSFSPNWAKTFQKPSMGSLFYFFILDLEHVIAY